MLKKKVKLPQKKDSGKQALKDRKHIYRILENKNLIKHCKNHQPTFEKKNNALLDWRQKLIDQIKDQYFLVSEITLKLQDELLFINYDKTSAFDVKAYFYQNKKDENELFPDQTLILSLQTLQSFEKKQERGKKIINELIKFSEREEIPITAWVETEELVKYFTSLKFKVLPKNEKKKKWAIVYTPNLIARKEAK